MGKICQVQRSWGSMMKVEQAFTLQERIHSTGRVYIIAKQGEV